MRKSKQGKFSRIQMQDELNAQADNSLDEMDVERIEKLVKKLNAYDKVKPDLSDYNRFLAEFNSKNGIKLQCSGGNKKIRLPNKRHTVFKISSKLASAAAVIVLAVFVSNAAVKADASDSISSWLSEVKNTVVFAFSDESYREWVLDNEKKHTYSLEHYGVDYCIDDEAFEDMEITNSEVDFNEYDWSDTLKPNYIPARFDLKKMTIMDIDNWYSRLKIKYTGPNDEYIIIYVERGSLDEDSTSSNKSYDTSYVQTLNINGFKAYIFIGERKGEAFFWSNGKEYKIFSTLNKIELCKVLENIIYENSMNTEEKDEY